ncbi:hypothetical protein [Halorubrum sp. BV1]|nr:hypothetical protein [Halorubrum sp. BV1]
MDLFKMIVSVDGGFGAKGTTLSGRWCGCMQPFEPAEVIVA